MSIGTAEIAGLLRELAQRTALRGGSPYRAKAYARAADNLLALSIPIDQLIAEDRLQEHHQTHLRDGNLSRASR